MAWSRVALSLAGALAVGHALSCGGTTRNGGSGAAGSGAGPSGGSSGAAGETGSPLPPGCEAMDARPSGARCASTAGYAWNGSLCEPIACSCVGSDCEQLFVSAEACDRAHDACYADQAIVRSCTKHSECVLQQRSCCPLCGIPPADMFLATHRDAIWLQDSTSCLGSTDDGCPECESGDNPSVYAACIEGQCGVVDVSASASCQADADCRLVSKDCCDCGGDFSSWGVMSVNDSYVRPARCDGVGCDGCVPNEPTNTYATCNSELSVCGLITGLH